MSFCSSAPVKPKSLAFKKIVGIPALIIVTSNSPISGTLSLSIKLPVGNISPSLSTGSINSILTSAAGKVTPSSSKSPVSCTWPSVMGTCAMMVLLIFCCQIRTSQMPFWGTLLASTNPLAIANEPTAAVKFPQLPDQSIIALSMATWPNK